MPPQRDDGQVIDRGIGAWVAACPDLELVARPAFGCVVFRFREARLNEAVPKALFASGRAVVGHTVVRGAACVKLTLCNPEISEEDVAALLRMIVDCGRTV